MPTPDEIDALAKRVNNWGRWGADDQLGTLNLLTPGCRSRAAALVRSGRAFSLSLLLSQHAGIQVPFSDRLNPVRTMIQLNDPMLPGAPSSNDDMVIMGLQAATHWDGLAHVSWQGKLYNGYDASTVTSAGAQRCGIHNVKTLVGRGVLLDVARARTEDRLPGGYAITAADLDAALSRAGTDVGPGDIVLVRTGHIGLVRDPFKQDKLAYLTPSPGLSTMTVEWLRDRDVAAVADDTLTFEVYPPEDPAAPLPVHRLHVVEMGLTQGQNFDLEELAADCAADGVYEFFLDASPLPFHNVCGSPVNPVAIK